MIEAPGAGRQPHRLGQPAAFVGREAELAVLAERLDRAGRGDSGVVLIAGEPGIGKTRLLQEFARLARSPGWLVLSGRAYDSEGMPAYLPFVEAIRERLDAYSDEDLLSLVEDAPAVASLIPELRAGPAAPPSRRPLNPEAERYRLFEAVSEFLLRVAGSSETAGLLLCLDDLHWADPSSLALLLYLSRKLSGERLLIAGSYRPGDVDTSPTLSSVLADMARERLADRITLPRMSPEETEALVEVLDGARPAPAVAMAIQREAEGNPFFVQELVRDLRSQGRDLASAGEAGVEWRVPGGVREVIGKRLSRLSDDSRRLLEAGAVLGDGFEFELAATVCRNSPDYLVGGLEQTLAAGMLVEEDPGYRFGHPLIRRTIYDGLSLPRRQALHLRAAEAIEAAHSRGRERSLAAIASHYSLAHSAPEKTVRYSRLAAEAAASVSAWQEAADHYEGALRSMDASGGVDTIRCDVLLALGETLRLLASLDRAVREIAPAALQLSQELGSDERALRACWVALDALQSGGALASAASPEYSRWCQSAHQYTVPGSVDDARLKIAVGRIEYATGRMADAARTFLAALDLAEISGDRETTFVAGWNFIGTNLPLAFEEERLRLARESIDWEQREVGARSYGMLRSQSARILLSWGDRTGAEQAWDEVRTLATRTKDPQLEVLALTNEAMLAMLDGRLEASAEAGDRQVTFAQRMGISAFAAVFGCQVVPATLGYLGRHLELAAYYASNQAILGNHAGLQPWAAPRRLHMLALLGRLEEAQAGLTQLVSDHHLDDGDAEASLASLALLLDVAVRLGYAEKAAVLAVWLRPFAYLFGTFCSISVGRLLGAAAELAGRYEEAQSLTKIALESSQQLRFRPEVALTRLQLAELLLKHYPHERSAALSHLDFAIDEFEDMGMQPSLDRALRLRGRRRKAEPDEPSLPDGLSQREVEVLRLIAAGRSNREIGEDLVLSVRTVERHITNLYAKIDARGKADATSYALRHELT